MPNRTTLGDWASKLLALGAMAACSRNVPPPEPDPSNAPTPAEDAQLEQEARERASAEAPGPAVAPSLGDTEPDGTVTAPPGPVEPPGPVPPPLEDEQGQPLPQTEAFPSTDSPFFQKYARELFQAIVSDDPQRASSFFFPVAAYRQVKDIEDPERDHERRLMALFARDVHTYHRKLGKNPEAASFVELRVPTKKAKWMAPGKEGNRVGYHRVLRSALVFRDVEGEERTLEVTSLISWRGEWYVVHLNGFK